MESVGVVYKFACDVLANQDFVEAFLRGQGRPSDQAAAAYSLGDLHKGAAKISNDILDSVGVSVYATTENSITVYATNGAICFRCNLLILTRVECPTFPKMAPETCPQPEPAKLSYEIQISLGTMILESKAQRRNPMICSLILLIGASTYWTPQKLPAQYIGVSNETPYGVMQFVHAAKLDGLPKIMSI
ncbi:hypothetical protein CFC21_087579 [Triticum aestivum]|uniref:Uncharacterized protein n=3 Tax=Triticum TaxID=4564 RepID=A0A9R0YI75_TRITD|nr:uncharacterized protein LOC123136507 isoform X4 [Triticum aestivum]KAF7083835.1 hypothetical protein CFC21_087579 [Triticum aestivum]VAI55902.1 unnamed protein product [Triticum turgidum subsp. durum]